MGDSTGAPCLPRLPNGMFTPPAQWNEVAVNIPSGLNAFLYSTGEVAVNIPSGLNVYTPLEGSLW